MYHNNQSRQVINNKKILCVNKYHLFLFRLNINNIKFVTACLNKTNFQGESPTPIAGAKYNKARWQQKQLLRKMRQRLQKKQAERQKPSRKANNQATIEEGVPRRHPLFFCLKLSSNQPIINMAKKKSSNCLLYRI